LILKRVLANDWRTDKINSSTASKRIIRDRVPYFQHLPFPDLESMNRSPDHERFSPLQSSSAADRPGRKDVERWIARWENEGGAILLESGRARATASNLDREATISPGANKISSV
jgi:hypothetical protein